jgi:hypothetical protein
VVKPLLILQAHNEVLLLKQVIHIPLSAAAAGHSAEKDDKEYDRYCNEK